MVDSYLPDHGDDSFDVTHYDLALTYSVTGNQLSGRARLSCQALRDIGSFELDLWNLNATKVVITGRRVQRFNQRRGRLLIKPGAQIKAGTEFEVVVHYRGKPGVVKDDPDEAGWEELTDGALVVGQPGGTPTWIPCNDRPDNKATYRFEITVPNDYTAVANGELVKRYRASSATTWTYELDKPMATYLASLQIGRYVEVPQESRVPLVGFLPPVRREAFERTWADQPDMMEFLVDLFGPYPYDSYRVVITDDNLEIPLEAGSFSTFGANFLSRDWDAQRLIVHEMAHQWVGNSLTLGEWKDIWLHEGFACYVEWLWSEECGLDSARERAEHHHKRLSGHKQESVLSDPGVKDMFDDWIYKRGALTLHAVRLTVGENAFFSMLKAWTTKHMHSTVTTEQFREFAAEHTGEDLEELFTAWLDEPALPDLPD